ncbi:MAG: hypothetical protein CVU24_08420 [Betaproteobacteria bacterium HGW-Betaproteobacteria-18]|nr:MAG: hypothetical protein CVU24_08420 [Betaproteobacteria bacterium HGW-Betaproteobacteria-18]
MPLTKKSWAFCLISAALLGSIGVSAQTVEAPTAPQTSPSRSFTTDLAKASLAKDGVTEATAPDYQTQLTAAETSIQALRDAGMGWGQVAHSLGLNLGAVVSAANRAQPVGAQNSANVNKPTQAGLQGQSAAASSRGGNGAGNSGGKGGGNSGGNSGGGRGK